MTTAAQRFSQQRDVFLFYELGDYTG
jgi:hypothetical protein